MRLITKVGPGGVIAQRHERFMHAFVFLQLVSHGNNMNFEDKSFILEIKEFSH